MDPARLLTAQQAKTIDLIAQDKFGISTLTLMENAGQAIAEELIKKLNKKTKIAFFCGKGNNGGDGFVAARQLLTRGIKADIFLASRIVDVQNEAKENLEILLKLGQRIIEASAQRLSWLEKKIPDYGLIVDALLGVGLRGEVSGVYRDLINLINASQAYVVSVDIPSGLDATTGKILGCCVKANETVTFVALKRGMVLRSGLKYCGRVIVEDLGIPL
jgi:hydroxyethylthiazole kinase-like uncharacterized protein yjeF